MLTMPSFKKSLIVEQFQGNDLNSKPYIMGNAHPSQNPFASDYQILPQNPQPNPQKMVSKSNI